MRKPPKLMASMLAAGLLSSVPALAGSFTANFNTADTTGFTLGSGAFIATNRLVLTPPVNSLTGSITPDDLDAGQTIEAFTATFKVQFGPGTANPADGLSFNFGPNVAPGGLYGEEGPGGSTLTVAFDIYDNGGGEAPAIDIKYADKVVAHAGFSKADLITSKLENVFIQLKKNGALSVSYKDAVVHTNVFIDHWVPSAGFFNISARTGGENAEMDIDDLSINTTVQGTPVAPTITANPQSATIAEGNPVTFTASVDGSAEFTFQWQRGGVDIQDATDRSYTIPVVHATDNNAKFRLKATNAASTATSADATLTVIADTVKPTVVKASGDTTFTQVLVEFSEPVTDTTALDPSNYSLNQGVIVQGVTLLNSKKVLLNTTVMPQGSSFILTVNGIKDTSTAGNTILANTHVNFRSFLFQTGTILHKKYNDLGDGQGEYSALQADPRYPNLPDRSDLLSLWEYPSSNFGGRDTASDPVRNWTDTSEGFFMPATSGEYVFFINGADRIDLYLSEDEDPANKHRIAYINGWTNPRGWLAGQGGTDMTRSRSDTDTGTEWPTGNTITLTKGKKYYMMLYHHTFSWSGGDQNGVTFKLAGEADPVAGDAPRLTGSLVGAFLDPTGASVTFVQQPGNASIIENRTATFTASATGTSAYGSTVTYQWQTAPVGSSTFTNIPAATKASYTTPKLTLADNGRQYRLQASVPSATESSQVASVAVAADTIPPVVIGAGGIASKSGATFDVGVTFDEPVDASSAGTIANYTMSSGTITGIKFYPQSPGVVLTVSGLTVGNTYTVTVANVADAKGNHMVSAPHSFKVSSMKWNVVGGDELNLGNGVIPVGDNGFDILSDGFTEWAAYDETTMVYEEITGDFDKELRVEYQDFSSQWARAGLIARDVSNFGVNRAAQEGGAAGRYQKIHVNPTTTAMGTGGNNTWETNRRLVAGGQSSAISYTTDPPLYPNAWCRLKREGQKFTVFRSNDGVNWIDMGSTTWPDAAAPGVEMPATMFVGPEYTPENGNVSAGLQAVFVAKIRDYRNHSVVVVRPALTYVRTASGLTITYEGTLESAATIDGTWSTVTGATSPYNATATGQKFFRAKK